MKKNAGLKVLTGAVVGVAALILMNSGHHSSVLDKQQSDPNNLNEAIASQFNDNIRDVAARQQETEKKLASLEAQNKMLKEQNTQGNINAPQTNNPELTKELDALKEQIAELKSSQVQQPQDQPYSINGEPAKKPIKKSTIKDIDQLLMKNENNQTELAYWDRLNAKRKSLTEKLKSI